MTPKERIEKRAKEMNAAILKEVRRLEGKSPSSRISESRLWNEQTPDKGEGMKCQLNKCNDEATETLTVTIHDKASQFRHHYCHRHISNAEFAVLMGAASTGRLNQVQCSSQTKEKE